MDYFAGWSRVIDNNELKRVVTKLNSIYSIDITPKKEDVFKAFQLCPLDTCHVVILGQDPYNDGNATGIAFGNNTKDCVSPSLRVLKDTAINLQIPHNCITFDPSLESWEKQGVLMLNSALTVEKHKPLSHMLLWREFIKKLIINLCNYNYITVFVLLGNTAKSFKPYIHNAYIIEDNHPSYYARYNANMTDIFSKINEYVFKVNNYKIKWFNYEESN